MKNILKGLAILLFGVSALIYAGLSFPIFSIGIMLSDPNNTLAIIVLMPGTLLWLAAFIRELHSIGKDF